MQSPQNVEIEQNEESAENIEKKGAFVKIRHVQIALLFSLLFCAFAIRGTLSVAIVAMTTNGTSRNPDVPVYSWPNANIILSSFFWSYAFIQFFAGHMAQLYGPKWFIAAAMVLNSGFCIAIPMFAEFFGSNGVMFCRIIQGLFQGFLLPLTHSMLGRWAPPHENSWINTTVYAVKIPWKAIFTSVPYWACIVGAIGESWGSTLLNTELPTYLTYVVKLDITQSSWFSSAPIFGMIAFGLCAGPTADFLINRGYTSRVTSRRMFHAIGTFIPALVLVCLSYVENKYAIGALLMICYAAQGSMNLGFWVNHIDISPRYSGILAGISNGSGQLVAILAPLMVHFVVSHDESNKKLWRTIFTIASLIYVATSIVFIVFVKAERQWWDSVHVHDNKVSNVNQAKVKDIKFEEIKSTSNTLNGQINKGFDCDT